MKKNIFFLVLFSTIFINSKVNSQVFYDYLGMMMSKNTLTGTARFVGSGGIIGSVGPDLSVLNTNPAGLGMFSKSEFSFTPSLQINNAQTNYIQFNNDDTKNEIEFTNSKYKFILNDVSVVFATRKDGKLKASNFAVGINRIADFNKRYVFGAKNPKYSYSSFEADQITNSYNLNPSDFPQGQPNEQDFNDYNARDMASYYNGLLFFDSASNSYKSYANGLVEQLGQREIIGGTTELSFAWAGSFNDKFYLGAQMGIPFTNMDINTTFQEYDIANTNTLEHNIYGKFVDRNLDEKNTFSGAGVNFKLGGLYKINNKARISGFVQSPTFYSLTESYELKNTTIFTNSTNNVTYNPDNIEFNLITPMRLGIGIGYVIGKHGFIGTEYEYTTTNLTNIDFGNGIAANISLNDYYKNDLKNTHTFKIGGEMNFEGFRLRAGYNYRTAIYPNKNVVEKCDLSQNTYTFGLGYKLKNFATDLAFITNQSMEYLSFYTDGKGMNYGLKNNLVTQQLLLTFNLRF